MQAALTKVEEKTDHDQRKRSFWSLKQVNGACTFEAAFHSIWTQTGWMSIRPVFFVCVRRSIKWIQVDMRRRKAKAVLQIKEWMEELNTFLL